MGNRSNINLVGNTTQGQNVGAGEGVYKDKILGNTLQFKGLAVTGTTMAITCDADNIYFSAATGGGGGGLTASNNGLCDNGTTVGLGGGLSNHTIISGGSGFDYGMTFSNQDHFCVDAATDVILCGCDNNRIDIGDGIILNGGNTTYIHMCNLQAKTSETNVLYIDAAGKIASGTTAAAAISGWTCTVNEGVSIGQYNYPYATGSFGINWNNIAIGSHVLPNNTTGYNNIAMGEYNMASNTIGGNNVSIGAYNMYFSTVGLNNTMVGFAAGYNNISGCSNTALGAEALYSVSNGKFNTAFGANALNNLDIGDDNVGLGNFALTSQICGCLNIGIGCESGQGIACGCNNIAIGSCSLFGADNSCFNIGIGTFAGEGTGSENIYIGQCAGYDHTGTNSVFIGGCSGSGATASNVLRIGNKKTGDLICGDFATDKVTLCCLQITAGAANGCVLTSDGSGNASWATGGGGGGYWSQSGTTIVYPTTGDCVKVYRAGRCIWMDGYGLISSSNELKISPSPITGAGGGQATICGGISNSSGAGGSVVLQGGFSYDNAGGGVTICPEIGVGGTGKFIVRNLPAKTSETCALYIHANGCVSTGTVAASVTFTGGTCEYSANNVCLGGLMGANTTLCLNGSTGSFRVCDTSVGLEMGICEEYSGAAVVLGQAAGSSRIVIDPTESDTIKIGGINDSSCGGLRIGSGVKLQSRETNGACVSMNISVGQSNVDIVGSCDTASSGGGSVTICGGNSTSGTGGSIRLCASTGGGANGGILMVNLPNVDGACTLKIASNVVSYCVDASDCRLKCCLEPITSATSILSNVCGYSVQYNEISELSGTCRYAMLAQDIELQLPLAVHNDVHVGEDTYKRIDYEQLIPVMWNIIKEQEARIQALENQ